MSVLRLLRVIALALMALWLWRRGRQPRPRPTGDGPAAGNLESLVRDRVCNTFLPRSRALQTRIDGVELWFCSEACRRAAVTGTTRVTP